MPDSCQLLISYLEVHAGILRLQGMDKFHKNRPTSKTVDDLETKAGSFLELLVKNVATTPLTEEQREQLREALKSVRDETMKPLLDYLRQL